MPINIVKAEVFFKTLNEQEYLNSILLNRELREADKIYDEGMRFCKKQNIYKNAENRKLKMIKETQIIDATIVDNCLESYQPLAKNGEIINGVMVVKTITRSYGMLFCKLQELSANQMEQLGLGSHIKNEILYDQSA